MISVAASNKVWAVIISLTAEAFGGGKCEDVEVRMCMAWMVLPQKELGRSCFDILGIPYLFVSLLYTVKSHPSKSGGIVCASCELRSPKKLAPVYGPTRVVRST